MTEYQRVVEKILDIPKFTKEKHDFFVLQEYLDLLGHPEAGRRVIHVAGTNGKGSVCRMLCGILQEAGRRCGGFFSPHLIRMNERIRVNGREIPDSMLVQAFHAVEGARREGRLPQLTFFEVVFVMALWYFREADVQDIVLETGLGGRLDATTGIPADLHVITEIGMDHEEYLGDTIGKIAAEKAGIITNPSPVVYHTGQPEADAVIRQRAEAVGCTAIVNCGEGEPPKVEIHPLGIDFSFQNDYDRYDCIHLAVSALYQVENAITAITAAHFLLSEFPREEQQKVIRRGLEAFVWEGRLEAVTPDVYVDGAHNPSAAHRLLESIKTLYGSGKWESAQLIFGASGDKDIRDVMRELCAFPWERIIVTRYRGSRAASTEELLQIARRLVDGEGTLVAADSLTEALRIAGIDEANETDGNPKCGFSSAKSHDGRIFTMITGSLYLVGELKSLLQGGTAAE